MKRLLLVWRIFRREALDTFRDWNMLSVVLLLPFVLMPLTGVMLLEIASQEAAALARDSEIGEPGKKSPGSAPRHRVAVLGGASGLAEDRLREWDRFVITPVGPPLPSIEGVTEVGTGETISGAQSRQRDALREEIRRRIGEDEWDAVLLTGRKPAGGREDLTNTWMMVFSDGTVAKSEKAGTALAKVLERWRKDDRRERLKFLGQTESALRPLSFASEEVAPAARLIAHHAAAAVPVLLFLLLASGCYYAAINAIPGEKERGTLATLLSAPLRPLDVLLGKWLNVSLVGVAGAFANTVSLLLTGTLLAAAIVRQAATGAAAGKFAGMSFDGLAGWFLALWPEIGLLLLSLIMVGMLFGALTLLACMFARGLTDAPYLLTPFILICCLPAAFAALPSMEWTMAAALTPGLNLAVLIRGIFRQESLGAGLVALAFLVNATTSMGVLVFGAWVFQSERIRFSEAGAWKDLLARRTPGAPNAAVSCGVVVVLVIGIFYAQFLTAGLGLAVMAAVSQAWIAAVPLGAAWYFRFAWREAFAWRMPRMGIWPGAVLLGLTAWAAAYPVSRAIPPPPEWQEAFAKPFFQLLSQPGGFALVLLAAAVLPAVCEELAFRGLVQTGFLKRFSPPVAIVLTALCFGLAHFSFYRFLPTAFLGLMLGWLAWRTRSLFPGMLVHAMNNGIAVCAMAASQGSSVPAEPHVPWPALAIGASGFAAGIIGIVRWSRASPTPPAPRQ